MAACQTERQFAVWMVDLRDRHWKRIVTQWTALWKLSIQTSLTSYAEQPATGRIGIDGAALEC
jgi:hypothetical protein